MPVIINGNPLTSLLEIVSATIDVDTENGATATITYNIQWDYALDAALAIATHPDYPALVRENVLIEREEGCIARVTITFKGVVLDLSGDDPKKSYSLRGTTSQEPIETHIKFTKWSDTEPGFGGPATPGSTNDQGATFDDKGKFVGFEVPIPTDDNPYYPYASQDTV